MNIKEAFEKTRLAGIVAAGALDEVAKIAKPGTRTGEIDKLAIKVSDFYSKQVDAIVDRLTSIIEPALIILIGVIIGIVLVAVYMPIFKFGSAF